MRARAYLHRRSKPLISFRCRVPAGLVATVGKREIVRTLRTDQAALARFLAAGIALRIAILWSLIRAMRTQNEVSRLIEVWFRRELDRAWRQYRSGNLFEAMVSDVEDPDERKRKADWYAGLDADHEIEGLQEEFRAGDFLRINQIEVALHCIPWHGQEPSELEDRAPALT